MSARWPAECGVNDHAAHGRRTRRWAVAVLAALVPIGIAWWSLRRDPLREAGHRPVAPPLPAPSPVPAEPGPAVSGPPPHPERQSNTMLSLMFSGSPERIQLDRRTVIGARPKPAPRPEGRIGLYFKATDAGGAILADGMLPDPFEIRVPLPKPGDALPPAVTAPIPPRGDAVFNVRLPDLPALHKIEIFRVPATAQPSEPRDRSDWRIGTFPLSGP